MAVRRVTDATAEPVSLEDLKIHLRIETTATSEDDLLEGLIEAARKEAENKTRRLCLPQTWKMTLDDFYSTMVLPWSPLSTNTTDVVITYLDETSGDSTTLDSTYYTVDVDAEPPRVRLAYGSDWPDVYPVSTAVTIQFKAGYPITTATPSTDTTPKGIETWIKMRAAGLYENRESMEMSFTLPREMGRHLDGLLDAYVVIEVAP